MSLSVDGFWKSGFWAQTFWADGFWREGEYIAPVVQANPSGGGRIYPYPVDKPKKKKVVRLPEKEYQLSGPLSKPVEHSRLPDWDQEAWEASLKTLAYLEAEDRKIRRKRTESALILWLIN